MNSGFDHAEDYDSKVDNYEEVSTVKTETAFQKWFKTFLEEKEVDLSEFLTADIQVGDVCQAIFNAPNHEQVSIKKMIVKIDFYNGNVVDYFKHLAQALMPEQVEKQRKEMVDTIFGKTMLQFKKRVTFCLGYEVQRVGTGAGKVNYHLVGKRATYRLVRSMNVPEYLHVINSRGNITSVRGNYTFTDKSGTLTAVS